MSGFVTEQVITCIGGANVDRKIQSLAPLQLGTSNPASVSETHGGVARNIAENLSRLGLKTKLITMVGEDAPGRQLLTACREAGMDVSHAIQKVDLNTGTYTAVLDADGNMTVALADMFIYDAFSVDCIAERWEAIAASRLVVADTNLPADTLAYLLQRAAQDKLPVCIAPVSSPKVARLPNDLHGVSLLITNLDELAALVHRDVDCTADEIKAAAADCIARGCERVVVTMGPLGCCYFQADGTEGHVSATTVDVVDVTGAGDAFVAGVTCGITIGATLESACRLGTHCAGAALMTKLTVSHEIRPQWAKLWLDEMKRSNTK